MATRSYSELNVVSRATSSISGRWRRTCNVQALSLPLLHERTTRVFTSANSDPESIASKAEAQSGAEVGAQRGIPGNLFVMAVEQVFDIHVGRDVVLEREPRTCIDAPITGGVFHRGHKAEEVRVGAPPDEGAGQVASP